MTTRDRSELRFIVIDDALHIRKIIKAVCLSMGVGEVVEASDGRNALELLKSKKHMGKKKTARRNFDLIICDWMMPEMSGFDLLKIVRNDNLLKNIPFLMVTAEHERDMVLKAIEEGVNDYIVKPFTADVLEAKVKKVLKIK